MRTRRSRLSTACLVCACLVAAGGLSPAVAESQAGQGNPFRALKNLFSRQAPEATEEEKGEASAEAKAAPSAEPAAARTQGRPSPSDSGDDAGTRDRGFSLKRLLGLGGGEAEAPAQGEESGEGSATPRSASRADKFVIEENGVPVFYDGPLQNRPPDVMLEKGTIVSVVKSRRGWTDVLLESGRIGTVASDLIRKAKASDFPAEHLDLVVRPGGAEGGRGVAMTDPVLDDVLPIPVAPPALPEGFDDEVDGGEPFAVPTLLLPPVPGSETDDEPDVEDAGVDGPSTDAEGDDSAEAGS